MYQHNGFFGCCYCTAPGATIDRHHCYYPYSQAVKVRESVFQKQCVTLAEKLKSNGQSSINVVGVKGRSAFSELVSGLPLSACIDYLHCVLIGVYQALLKLHVKLMDERKETESFITETACLSLPCEPIDHGRNVRSVAELKDFKANEFLNYVFYAGVILLRGRIPAAIYHHYLKLVFGVRLLLETSAESDILVAEILLDSFC